MPLQAKRFSTRARLHDDMRLTVLLFAAALALTFVPGAAADPIEGDVFLPPLTGCTWSGSYKPVAHAGPVTIWEWSCDPET